MMRVIQNFHVSMKLANQLAISSNHCPKYLYVPECEEWEPRGGCKPNCMSDEQQGTLCWFQWAEEAPKK